MAGIIVGSQSALTGSIGVDDAQLIFGVDLENLANVDDFPGWRRIHWGGELLQ